ncbi:hypothetical protein AAFF_G00367920 [Aldrovandia affinis]|uniref:TRAF1-6 MATH domain-containing protein n=1 Tax=Aldrovandia affinis TaxID=143900 RepID=A0AAD7R5C0_9TELE|nr:hypothetical protein AAFF_G00367920 [Aldrovandia affinis]
MSLQLYLNGDGTGRGTHLSLFFMVMRGKYDALLKWPFSQKPSSGATVASACAAVSPYRIHPVTGAGGAHIQFSGQAL